MKTYSTFFIAMACLMVTCCGFGQTTEGVIEYEVKVNMHRTLPPDRAEMKNMIPEFRTTRHQLFFNAQESLYKPVIEDEDATEVNEGNVRIRMQAPHLEVYFDAGGQRRIVQQEFMGKDYLLEDSLAVIPWKFSADKRKVLGYDCQQASYYDEIRKQKITAWYTSKLRPFLGPEMVSTLPGAVLMLDINDGERVVTAMSVSLRALKKNELKVPDKGIKTTQKEFQKLRDEHMERMRANGANVIIRN